MWTWLRRLLETLQQAVGVRRFSIDGAVGLALWLVAQATSQWEGWPLAGAPSWLIALPVILFLLFWWVLNYATELRIQREPRVKLTSTTGPNGEALIQVRAEPGASMKGVVLELIWIKDGERRHQQFGAVLPELQRGTNAVDFSEGVTRHYILAKLSSDRNYILVGPNEIRVTDRANTKIRVSSENMDSIAADYSITNSGDGAIYCELVNSARE
jgi:hypothetical protein